MSAQPTVTTSIFSGDLRTFTFVKVPQFRTNLDVNHPGFYGTSGGQEFFLPLSLLSDTAGETLTSASADGTLDGFEGSRIRYAGGRISHPSTDRVYPQEFGFDPSTFGSRTPPAPTPTESAPSQSQLSVSSLTSPASLARDGSLVDNSQDSTGTTATLDLTSDPSSQESNVGGQSVNAAHDFTRSLEALQPSRTSQSQPNRYNNILATADSVRRRLSYSRRPSNLVSQPSRLSVPIGTRSQGGHQAVQQASTVPQTNSTNLFGQTNSRRPSHPNYYQGQPTRIGNPRAQNVGRQTNNSANSIPLVQPNGRNIQRPTVFAGNTLPNQVPPTGGTSINGGSLAPPQYRQMPATNATAVHSQPRVGGSTQPRQSASFFQNETGPSRYNVPDQTQELREQRIPPYLNAAPTPHMPNNIRPWVQPMNNSNNRPGYVQHNGNNFQSAPNPPTQQQVGGRSFDGINSQQTRSNLNSSQNLGYHPRDYEKRSLIPPQRFDLVPTKVETYQQLREQQSKYRSKPDISVISRMNPETARTYQSVGWDVMNAANDGTYTKALNTRQFENDITVPSQPDDFTQVDRNGKMQRARLPLKTWLDPNMVYSSYESPRLPQYANLKVTESKHRLHVLSPLATRTAHIAMERLVLSQACMDRVFPFLHTYVSGSTPEGDTDNSRDYLNSLLDRWRSMTHTCLELLALSLKQGSNATIDLSSEEGLFQTSEAILAGFPINDDHAKSVLYQAVAGTNRKKPVEEKALVFTKAISKSAGAYSNHMGKLKGCNITDYVNLFPKNSRTRFQKRRNSNASLPNPKKAKPNPKSGKKLPKSIPKKKPSGKGKGKKKKTGGNG